MKKLLIILFIFTNAAFSFPGCSVEERPVRLRLLDTSTSPVPAPTEVIIYDYCNDKTDLTCWLRHNDQK